MSMVVKGSAGRTRTPVPVGTHKARCLEIVALGDCETPWGKKPRIYLRFELPEITETWTDENGQEQTGPATMGTFCTYTLGTSEKPSKLRELLEGWRGRPFTPQEAAGFDIEPCLGKPVVLVVKHGTKQNGDVRDEIGATSPAKESEVPALVGTPVLFNAYDPDMAVFASLPEWMQGMIQLDAPAAPQAPSQPLPGDEEEDFIPF